MKTYGNPPKWATDLMRKEMKAEGLKMRQLPDLEWSHRNSECSTGLYSNWRWCIKLNAGSDLVGQRSVLLHELAHHLTHLYYGAGNAHNGLFWKTAFRLYERNGLADYARKRDRRWTGADVAYNRLQS